jgi:hypothetical protein
MSGFFIGFNVPDGVQKSPSQPPEVIDKNQNRSSIAGGMGHELILIAA